MHWTLGEDGSKNGLWEAGWESPLAELNIGDLTSTLGTPYISKNSESRNGIVCPHPCTVSFRDESRAKTRITWLRKIQRT